MDKVLGPLGNRMYTGMVLDIFGDSGVHALRDLGTTCHTLGREYTGRAEGCLVEGCDGIAAGHQGFMSSESCLEKEAADTQMSHSHIHNT